MAYKKITGWAKYLYDFYTFLYEEHLKIYIKKYTQGKEARYRGVHTAYMYYKHSTVNKSRWVTAGLGGRSKV